MNEIIRKNQIYEKDELEKIFKLNLDHVYRNRSYVTYYLLGAIIFFAIGSTYLGNDIEKSGTPGATGLIFLAVSFLLLYYHFTDKKRTAKRQAVYQSKNDKPADYIMNINGMKEITKTSESFYDWSHYRYYIEKDGIMLLYDDIGLRMFSSKYYSNEEWKQLQEWIKLKVKPFGKSQ